MTERALPSIFTN